MYMARVALGSYTGVNVLSTVAGLAAPMNDVMRSPSCRRSMNIVSVRMSGCPFTIHTDIISG